MFKEELNKLLSKLDGREVNNENICLHKDLNIRIRNSEPIEIVGK